LIVLALAAAAFAISRAWPALLSRPTASVVRASGRIEGREVTIAAKTIQGRVGRLLADEGQRVQKGQLLAELDAAQVEAQVAAARATVATLDAQVRQAILDVTYTAKNSEASIAAADAALSSAQAHVVRATAILVNATAANERAAILFRGAALSKQELDAAAMTLGMSRADLAAAEKDVTRAEANLALAQASKDTIGLKRQQLQALEESRRAAAARLEEAQANLAERLIIAPGAGTIVSRTAEVGDVVGPGSPIFQIVDMNQLYLKVYIPEPDIAKLRLGDPVEVFVDAFPGRSFEGRLSKIRDQAEFTPKNVETAEERLKLVFGVELALTNPDSLLKPGMPADCVIHWKPANSDGNGHGS
jgi:HlyD family secretion protein